VAINSGTCKLDFNKEFGIFFESERSYRILFALVKLLIFTISYGRNKGQVRFEPGRPILFLRDCTSVSTGLVRECRIWYFRECDMEEL